ncbi:ABC-type transport auxiliary lipoprotein family protein [Delftia acidovorans]|uniref:ABC-type transport auxiliary lipoprotein family protein n=1 Tax=Delftia acidovorans TaxID=80866 RepID=UPI0022ABC386|nr:ABC-type transport auxiliary lipoprotein family protein [Delftia acidovorans]WAT86025.1 ABC-type transport auxiliary lipoprotein family protein [Delftia acidovorans]
MSPSRKTAVASAGLAAALILLAGCSALPQPPAQPARYDFGLAPLSAPAQSATSAAPQARTPLALADVEAPALSDGSTAMFYRLAYANGQELRPYQLARWSQPPALLLQQRLRSQLGLQRPVLASSESVAQPRLQGAVPTLLRVDIEEFSQVFDAPGSSAGVVRLRATLVEQSGAVDRLLGQKLFEVRSPAASGDAAGGAKALATAADAAIAQIDAWLGQQGH